MPTTRFSPTTYAVQTAQSALKNYDINLSKEAISKQIQQPQSFYKQLWQPLISQIYNRFLSSEITNMQNSCAEWVINILYTNENVRRNRKTNVAELTESQQQRVTDIQNRNDQIDQALQSIHQTLNQTDKKMENSIHSAYQRWNQHITQLTDNIIDQLTQNDFVLSEGSRDDIQARLDQLNDDEGSTTQTDQTTTSAEQAVVKSLTANNPQIDSQQLLQTIRELNINDDIATLMEEVEHELEPIKQQYNSTAKHLQSVFTQYADLVRQKNTFIDHLPSGFYKQYQTQVKQTQQATPSFDESEPPVSPEPPTYQAGLSSHQGSVAAPS